MILGLCLAGSVVEVVALNLLMRCGIGGVWNSGSGASPLGGSLDFSRVLGGYTLDAYAATHGSKLGFG
jgi:hypothetical protein